MEINKGLFDALGMTLIDSLWQGAVIMSIAFLGLWLMKKRKASLRHNFLLLCILALPILGLYSFSQRFERASLTADTRSIDEGVVGKVDLIVHLTESVFTPPVIESDAFEWVELIPWIGVIWTIGLILFLLRSVGAYLYLNRLKSEAIDIIDVKLTHQFHKLKEGINLKGSVLLRESAKVSSPMVYGYFKPIILFPLGLIQGLTTDEVEVILLHELAHLKRNDFLINMIINGLRAIYFYHPAFWWLQSQLENEREFASDEMVMSKQSNGLILVKALAKAQEYKMTTPSLGFAGNSKNQLLKRVNRIMKKQQNPNWTGLLLPCIMVLSVFLFTSQSEKSGLNVETQSSVSDTIPPVENWNGKGPILIDFDPGTKYESSEYTNDSLGIFYIEVDEVDSLSNAWSDTTTVAQAAMEIIAVPSPISIVVTPDGIPTQIKRNGRELDGLTFKIYQEAYLKLNKYSSHINQKRISGENEQVLKRIKLGRVKDNYSDVPNIEVQNTGLDHLFELESRLVREKAFWNEAVAYAANNPSKTQEKALSDQMNQVIELRGLIDRIERTMDVDQMNMYLAYKESQQLIANAAQQVKINRQFDQASVQMESALKAAEAKFDQMVMKATANPNEADPVGLNKQAIRVAQMEEELAINKYVSIKNGGANPIIEVDGVLMPKAALSDLDMSSIASFEVYRGRSQAKRYPNGETKGRSGLIVLKTIESESFKGKFNRAEVDKFLDSRGINDGLMEHTRVTPDFETFTFAQDPDRAKWVKYTFEQLFNKNTGKKLFIVNGEVMKDWTFKDAEAMDFDSIKAIDFAANKDMKKYFGDTLSKKILRNYESVISIKTM